MSFENIEKGINLLKNKVVLLFFSLCLVICGFLTYIIVSIILESKQNLTIQYKDATVTLGEVIKEAEEKTNELELVLKTLNNCQNSLTECIIDKEKCLNRQSAQFIVDHTLMDIDRVKKVMDSFQSRLEFIMHKYKKDNESERPTFSYLWYIPKGISKSSGYRARLAWNDDMQIIKQTQNDMRMWDDNEPRKIMFTMNRIVFAVQSETIDNYSTEKSNAIKPKSLDFLVRAYDNTNVDFRKGNVQIYIPIDEIGEKNPRLFFVADAYVHNQKELSEMIDTSLTAAIPLIFEIKKELYRVQPELNNVVR